MSETVHDNSNPNCPLNKHVSSYLDTPSCICGMGARDGGVVDKLMASITEQAHAGYSGVGRTSALMSTNIPNAKPKPVETALQKYKKKLYAMGCGESLESIGGGHGVLRVPGGWIYVFKQSSNFVPLHNEFLVWDEPTQF